MVLIFDSKKGIKKKKKQLLQETKPRNAEEFRLTVRLSLSSCMIRVLSLYDSSFRLSSSAMASSNA